MPTTTLFTNQPTPRQPAIPLLVELCAGTAALSLRLERAKARPPVSRQGAKTGYADAILALAGLQPGDKAEHYVWCEPDAGVRLLLHAYRDAKLAREAAAIIRGWADEDPRALWERLRAEGPAVCPPVDAREAGRWLTVQGWSYAGTNMLDPAKCGIGNIDSNGRHWGVSDQGWIEGRLLRASAGIPATIHNDARTLDTPDEMPPGALVYMDGPYENTTGYAALFPRAEQVEAIRRWDAAGARCMASEAVPIEELTALGWHVVDIGAMRVGQKRTFGGTCEYVTMNFEPDPRALRACILATERAERRAKIEAGGEQSQLF